MLLSLSNLGCVDSYAACYRWAADGQCGQLPQFMELDCAASCGACHSAATDPCLPVHDAVGPGSIAEIFGRAASLSPLTPSVLSIDPFIVMLDNFASLADAAELTKLAEGVGFGGSGSSCGFKPACNSASMSCIPVAESRCWEHGAMRRFEQRMLDVLQLPADNCEPLRFFRYERG
jgi:hypothetical protein